MTQEELILGRLIARDPYTAIVIHDTDLDGVNVVGKNPALMEGDDFWGVEEVAMAEMPKAR